jgi:chromosome segregation ATPase
MGYQNIKDDLEKEKRKLSDMESDLRHTVAQLKKLDVNVDDMENELKKAQKDIDIFVAKENKLELKLKELFGEENA